VSVAKELSNKMFMSAHVNDIMTATNMTFTRVNPSHKICCNIEKNDHIMGTKGYMIRADSADDSPIIFRRLVVNHAAGSKIKNP
jgi:hypothetical protein